MAGLYLVLLLCGLFTVELSAIDSCFDPEAQQQCCSGYSGPSCLPDCSDNPCSENYECSEPHTCTCQEGWDGDDCMIDINECLENNLCEVTSSCVNTLGSFKCSCGVDSVIANDGRRCLDPVTNVAFITQTQWAIISFSLPQGYADDGEYYGTQINCTSNFQTINFAVLGSNSSANLSNLLPFTNYSCFLTPLWTNNGKGLKTFVSTITPEDIPEGPPSSININVSSSQSIIITWDLPEVPNGVITAFTLSINYTNGSSIDIRNIPGDIRLYLLQHLNPYQDIIVYMTASTTKGEGPRSPYFYTQTLQDVPGPVLNFNVSVLTDYAANISWHPPFELNGIITAYHFQITSLTSVTGTLYFFEKEVKPHQDFFIALHNLSPFIPYYVEITAQTIIGRGELSPLVFFTNTNRPTVHPIIQIYRTMPTIVTVKWNPLTLEELRGFLNVYHVVISESLYNCTVTRTSSNFNTTTASITFNDLKASSSYCISVAASTSKGIGPYSSIHYISAFESSYFELHILGFSDCRQWLSSNQNDIVAELTDQLRLAVNHYCNCTIFSSQFNSMRYICDERDYTQVIVQGGISGINSTLLVEYLQDWVVGYPNVLFNNTPYTIDGSCDVHVDSLGLKSLCLTNTISSERDLIVSGFVSGIIVAFVIIISFSIIASITVIIRKKRNANNNDELKTATHNRRTLLSSKRTSSFPVSMINDVYEEEKDETLHGEIINEFNENDFNEDDFDQDTFNE